MQIKAIAFDMDGTLAPAKDRPSDVMAELFVRLLGKFRIAIISGASYEQFQEKFLGYLPNLTSKLSANLLLLPTTGSVIYAFRNTWAILEEHYLSDEERKHIIAVLKECIENFKIPQSENFVRQIDDRRSQVTFSGCGQDTTEELKEMRAKFDPSGELRQKMVEYLEPKLPNHEIRSAGSTSIDITRKNLDKAFGIRRVLDIWDLRKNEIIYIGDAVEPTGNDYAVLKAGILTKFVKNHIDTETWILNLLNNE